jgi:hypothetical protein
MKQNLNEFGRSADRVPCRPLRSYFRPMLDQLEGRQLLSTSVLTYHNDLARSGANPDWWRRRRTTPRSGCPD